MWDSAKKPIKVRSVLQPNGMRHFIVNEETEETHIKPILQQRRNSNKTIRPSADNETFSGQQQASNAQSNGLVVGNENNNSSTIFTENHYIKKERTRRDSIGNSYPPLLYSSSNDSSEDRWALPAEHDGNFFGVSGSKIHNSKKYKGQHSRHIHQFPHGTKSNVEMTRYPHLLRPSDVLDLVPVKSPVIKKLISGRVNSTDHNHHHDNNNNQRHGPNQRNGGGTQSTTLCSRIMTWIDLEVKRNAASSYKGKSTSGSLSFNSADLSIVNELTLPGDYDQSSTKITTVLSSSPLISDSGSGGGGGGNSSSASSSSGESSTNASSSCMSSSSSTCSSSTVSLPKLTPCWRKEGSSGCGMAANSNKTKKSVRIAEDLPRWGKMKRRLRRKTLSLNELYEDEPFSPAYDCRKKTDYNSSSSSSKLQSRKAYSSSVSDLLDERSNISSNLHRAEGGEEETAEEEKETDSFVVRDERLLSSGKLQVHIFLPQTESASGRAGGGGAENSGNISGRSEDSTS